MVTHPNTLVRVEVVSPDEWDASFQLTHENSSEIEEIHIPLHRVESDGLIRDLDAAKLLGFGRDREIRPLIKSLIKSGFLRDVKQFDALPSAEESGPSTLEIGPGPQGSELAFSSPHSGARPATPRTEHAISALSAPQESSEPLFSSRRSAARGAAPRTEHAISINQKEESPEIIRLQEQSAAWHAARNKEYWLSRKQLLLLASQSDALRAKALTVFLVELLGMPLDLGTLVPARPQQLPAKKPLEPLRKGIPAGSHVTPQEIEIRAKVEREIEDDYQQHIENMTRFHMCEGHSETKARAQATKLANRLKKEAQEREKARRQEVREMTLNSIYGPEEFRQRS